MCHLSTLSTIIMIIFVKLLLNCLLTKKKKVSAKQIWTYRNIKKPANVSLLSYDIDASILYLFLSIFLFLKEMSTLQKPIIQMLKFMVCPFRQRGSQRKTVSVWVFDYKFEQFYCADGKKKPIINKTKHLTKLIYYNVIWMTIYSI